MELLGLASLPSFEVTPTVEMIISTAYHTGQGCKRRARSRPTWLPRADGKKNLAPRWQGEIHAILMPVLCSGEFRGRNQGPARYPQRRQTHGLAAIKLQSLIGVKIIRHGYAIYGWFHEQPAT